MNTRLAAVLASPALDARRRSHLRLIRADMADAVFVTRLRNNPALNRHLNAPASTAENQLRWLQSYKVREAAGTEFYFVIVCDGADKGVVRLYDFREIGGRPSFCWGSWIIAPPPVPGLAIHSLLLVLSLGFEVLCFDHSHFDVRTSNDKCVGLYGRLGAIETFRDTDNLYLSLTKESFILFKQVTDDPVYLGHSTPA